MRSSILETTTSSSSSSLLLPRAVSSSNRQRQGSSGSSIADPKEVLLNDAEFLLDAHEKVGGRRREVEARRRLSSKERRARGAVFFFFFFFWFGGLSRIARAPLPRNRISPLLSLAERLEYALMIPETQKQRQERERKDHNWTSQQLRCFRLGSSFEGGKSISALFPFDKLNLTLLFPFCSLFFLLDNNLTARLGPQPARRRAPRGGPPDRDRHPAGGARRGRRGRRAGRGGAAGVAGRPLGARGQGERTDRDIIVWPSNAGRRASAPLGFLA